MKNLNLGRTFSYGEFERFVTDLVGKGKATGEEQTEERIKLTKVNLKRMERLDRSATIGEALQNALTQLERPWTWVLLLEGWCTDGALNAPFIAKMVELNPNLNLKIILRDEHPAVIDAYLTNGGRAIPKLICIDDETNEVIGTWGPRPYKIQSLVKQFKTLHPEADKTSLLKNLLQWYRVDSGRSLQKEFELLVCGWVEKVHATNRLCPVGS